MIIILCAVLVSISGSRAESQTNLSDTLISIGTRVFDLRERSPILDRQVENEFVSLTDVDWIKVLTWSDPQLTSTVIHIKEQTRFYLVGEPVWKPDVRSRFHPDPTLPPFFDLDFYEVGWLGVNNCSIPDDHISPRRSAFFMAGSVLRDLRSAGLNRLIGLVRADFGEAEDKDLQALNAIDFRTTEPVAPADPDRRIETEEDRSKMRANTAQSVVTAKKMQEAVTAFEGRCKSLKGKPIGTAELVRLRALLQIILSHSQAVHGNSAPTQILPVDTKDGYDWPRLVGRLLKQHFGTSRALQQLCVEQDEAEQNRVMEYLALADWAARAAAQAVKANPKATDLRGLLDGLAKSLQAQVLLILGDVAEDKQYFDQLHAKLDERFSARLGLNLSQTI